MRSVNTVVIPELSNDLVVDSVKRAHSIEREQEDANKQTALDFYFNDKQDLHLMQWFSAATLRQVPPMPSKVVPRFAKARMMLYKRPPERLINGEVNEDYKEIAHLLNTKTREFAELTWLTAEMAFRTKYNDMRERLEYQSIPFFTKYFLPNEFEPFGVSYEIAKQGTQRRFVFFSEDRDDMPGLHFKFTQGGDIIEVAEGNLNPYDVIPVSFAGYPANAYDVVRLAIQLGILNTEVALNARFAFGQPVMTGAEPNANSGKFETTLGIDKVMYNPEGSKFEFVNPGGSIPDMMEAGKGLANQTATNNGLRVKLDESSSPMSGEAIRLLEIENLESRISDIPMWRDWEKERYEIDREVWLTHTGQDLGEAYDVDFAEVAFPLTPQEERDQLDWELAKGLKTREDLIRHFNPDIDDAELALKLAEVDESRKVEADAVTPQFQGLRRLGEVGS